MKLQSSYSMSSFSLDENGLVTPKQIDELMYHVNEQLQQISTNKHKLYIDSYGTSTDDLTEEITFCLNDWRNDNYTLFWTVNVEIADIMEFIEDNYNLEALESTAGDLFNDNERDICLDYLQSKDLETLNFI